MKNEKKQITTDQAYDYINTLSNECARLASICWEQRHEFVKKPNQLMVQINQILPLLKQWSPDIEVVSEGRLFDENNYTEYENQ